MPYATYVTETSIKAVEIDELARMISGEPYTLRGVRTVRRGVLGDLL